jgi:hypothetical protein
MKPLFSFLLIPALLFSFSFIRAQDLKPVKSKGKYGYVDAGDNFIIKPKYRNAAAFSEGLAAVKKKKDWGYINTKEMLRYASGIKRHPLSEKDMRLSRIRAANGATLILKARRSSLSITIWHSASVTELPKLPKAINTH